MGREIRIPRYKKKPLYTSIHLTFLIYYSLSYVFCYRSIIKYNQSMFKYFLVVSTIFFAIIACNKKAVPVITERKVDPPKIAVSVYPPNPAIAADTAMGKEVFVTRCGRCHELPKPAQFTFNSWDGILTSMVPRAKLNAEQSAHITAYIKANAAK